MIDKTDACYIALRSGIPFAATGAPPVNTDDRLWNPAGGPFVLSLFRDGSTLHYAVSDGDAEEFIEKVLRQSGEDARAPGERDAGEVFTAEVRIGGALHPFRDGRLLKAWLEELQGKCGEPLSSAEYYRRTHPAPPPPAADAAVTKIVEQAVLPYRSPAVLGPGPDNCRSELLVEGDFAVLSVFRDGMHLEYRLPPELLPEVNAAARELLDHPGDGYHSEWDEDAWLKVKGREEEFDAEPEEVLKLFESLVGRCGDPIPRKERMDFYKVYLPSVRKKLDAAWDCPLCSWKRNTAAFCEGCGAKREDIPSGRAVSAPKPKAPAPWSCLHCGTVGNSGGYCCECGAPVNAEERFTGESGPIGYRRGRGTGGFLRMLPNGMVPAPQPAPQSQPRTANPSAPPLSSGEWFCTACGARNSGRFCTECGKAKND